MANAQGTLEATSPKEMQFGHTQIEGGKTSTDQEELVGVVKQIARIFEQAMSKSARAPESDKSTLTIQAVSELVRALVKIDSEVGDNRDFADSLRKILRSELESLRSRGSLWNHALGKPYGYPGDFHILNAIYENNFVSTNTVGRELDRALLTSQLSEAVRCRKNAVVSHLHNEIRSMKKMNIKILDLACGPCVDVSELLDTNHDSRLSILCVDHDKAALEFAKSVVGLPPSRHKVVYVQANALRLRLDPNMEIKPPFDIIYSVGLLDYIPDRLAQIALRNWWKMLSPGGLMLTTIKDSCRYDPTFYDWMADWTFVHRSERQFLDLLEASVIAESQLHFERDETGVSIIALAHK